MRVVGIGGYRQSFSSAKVCLLFVAEQQGDCLVMVLLLSQQQPVIPLTPFFIGRGGADKKVVLLFPWVGGSWCQRHPRFLGSTWEVFPTIHTTFSFRTVSCVVRLFEKFVSRHPLESVFSLTMDQQVLLLQKLENFRTTSIRATSYCSISEKIHKPVLVFWRDTVERARKSQTI